MKNRFGFSSFPGQHNAEAKADMTSVSKTLPHDAALLVFVPLSAASAFRLTPE